MNGRKNLQVVRQATATECGLACVAMIATYHGVSTDLASLRRKHEVSLKGATLAGISSCCTELGLSTRAVRCDVHELKKLRTPCILHWRFNHFVVLKSVKEDRVVVHDPARGVVSEPLAVVSDAFTGIALELHRQSAFAARSRCYGLNFATLSQAIQDYVGSSWPVYYSP